MLNRSGRILVRFDKKLNRTAAPPQPTFAQLQRAFQALHQQHGPDLRLCLVIDCLDEYDCTEMGYPDLADLFKSASESKNIKILAASIPLLVYEEAFASSPYLRLQDLTAKDMATYARDKLQNHQRMPDPVRKNSWMGDYLTSTIVSKASGVFLRVKLVVGNLLDSLANPDDIHELLRSSDELPEALEDLFQHMFARIPQHCRHEAYLIFRIVPCSRVPFEGSTGIFGLEEPFKPEVLSFATEADGDRRLQAETEPCPLSVTESCGRRSDLERRLKSRCCGLLELHSYGEHLDPQTRLNEGYVQFIHKTVPDFLNDKVIWDSIPTGKGKPDEFDPNTALLDSFIVQLKHLDLSHEQRSSFAVTDPDIWALIHATNSFAKRTKHSPIQARLLQELDHTMILHWKRNRPLDSFPRPSTQRDFKTGDAAARYLVILRDNFSLAAVCLGIFSSV